MSVDRLCRVVSSRVHSSLPPTGRIVRHGRRRALKVARAAALAALAVSAAMPRIALAGTELDVANPGSTQDLSATGAATAYVGNASPTTTSDVTFMNAVYTSPTFTTVAAPLSIGTINDLSATALIINGPNAITLNGGSNSVALADAGTAADLIYVASGGNLSFGSTTPIVLTTTAATGNFDFIGSGSIGAAISGTGFGFTKTGAGTLTLSGTNTFSGGMNINNGIVSVSTVSNLGSGGISLNGGTLKATAAVTQAAGNIITVGAAGGTLDNAFAGKFTIGVVGGLTGSGMLTRSASASNALTNIVSITAANAGFTGSIILNGGVTEPSAGGLGTAAVTINTGGELAVSNNTFSNSITITGGVLGGDNGVSTLSGPITVSGAFSIRLGDFWQATQRNLNISGPISGTGVITFLNANNATVASNAQLLTLSGNNTGYNSNISIPAAVNVSFTNANSQSAGGTTVNSNATGLGGIGFGFDFGATVPTFTNTLTGTTTGGIFAVNTTLAATTTLDMSAVGNGTMFLGSQGTGTYAASTLTVGSGSTYRLGGGGGTLTISNGVLNGANNLVVNDTRTNGGGTIILAGNNGFTGTTTINAGTLQIGNGSTTGSIGNGAITLGAATLAFKRSDPISISNVITANNVASTFAVNGGSSVTLSASGNTLGIIQFNTTAGGILNIGANDTTFGVNGGGGALIAANVSGTINSSGGRLKLNNSAGDIGAASGVTLTINAAIINGTQSAIDYFNSGGGTVVLNGANTYTGVSSIQNAIVVVNSLNSVNLGTPLFASSSLGAPTTIANGTIKIGTTTTSATLRYVGTGENTDRVIDLAGTTGGATIDQSGSGLLKFTSNFTATGVGAKTLTLTGSTSGTGEISGKIVDSSGGATSIIKTGTGTWTLSGANTYTGTTQVLGGTLNITGTTGATSITLNNAGSASYQVNTAQTLGTVTFAAGEDSLISNYAGSGSQALTVTSVSRTAGAVGILEVVGGSNGTTNKIVISGLGTTAQLVNFGTFFNTAANGLGATYAFNDTGGFIRGIQYGSDPTTQLLTATTASASSAAGVNLRTTSSITAQNTDAFVTLNLAGTDSTAANNSLTLAATQTLTVNSILKSGGNSTAIISGGTGVTTTSGGDFVIRVDAATDVLTIGTPILANGANILTKSGAGVLKLGNGATITNTFTGAINVFGGTLSYTGTGSSADPVSLGAGSKTITIANGATLQITGAYSNPTSTNSKNFVIGPGGGTFDVQNGSGLTLDDSGQFSGTGNLTVTGAGTGLVYLHNQAFAFSGNVIINSGTLRLGTNSVLGTSTGRTITVNSGGDLDANTTVTAANVPLAIVLNGGTLSVGATAPQGGAASGSFAQSVSLTAASNLSAATGLTETVSGNISGGFGITKLGPGITILSGTNTYSGGTLVSAGILQFNGNAAVPSTGTINIPSSAIVTLSDFTTSGVANAVANIAPASNGVLSLLGTSATADVDFTNQPNVFLGTTGAITYTGTFTPPSSGTVNLGGGGGTLTYNPNLLASNVTNVNIGSSAATGTVVMAGTNTYTGTTTVNTGSTLSISADANLGAPGATVAMNGGTLLINGTGGTLLAGGRPATFPLGGTINVANSANTYVVNAGGAAGGAITKAGPGALTMNGSMSTASNVSVTGGTLTLSGGLSGSSTATTLAYGAQAGNTIVNVTSGANVNLFQKQGANNATAVTVWNQTGGTVQTAGSTGDTDYVSNLGYGYFNLTGGTFRDTVRFDVVAPTNAATGVVYIGNGGTLNNNGGEWMILAYNGTGQMTIGPGGSLTRVGATNLFGIMLNKTGANGTLNVAGGSVDTGNQAIRFGNGAIATTTGFVNLAGGTLSIGNNASVNVGTAATNITNAAYYNFAGGTMRFTAATTAAIPASIVTTGTTNFTSVATIFGAINNSALAGAPSFNGGLTVDTNGFATTVAEKLLAATGSGVTQANIAIPGTGNSGYIGAPAVTFSTTGVVAGGTPASGYALISGGQVSGIVITNPGTYTAGSTPSITLTGGGGTIAAFNTTALNTANNTPTPGGLTKIGNGTLTLTNQSSYTGATTINAGGLTLDFTQIGTSQTNSPSNYINASSSLAMTGGTFTLLGRANGAATSAGAWTGTVSSPTITFTTLPTGIVVGQAVTGTGITGSGTTAYIVSINTTNKTVTLDAGVTAVSGADFATPATTMLTSQTFNGASFSSNPSFIVVNANGGGGTVLNLGALTHPSGGTIDITLPAGTQSTTNGATTTTPLDAGSQYASWLTVNGGQLATNDGNGNIIALTTGFTDIAARGPGSVVPNDPNANVRINSAGTSGNVTLASTADTVANLMQNTTTASTIDTAGSVLRVAAGGTVSITAGNQALTIGTAANSGSLTAGGADNTGGDLILGNFSTNTLTINAAITDNGAGVINLIKSGSGTAVITGTSTYSGTTTVSVGTLQVGSGSTTGTLGGGAITINSGATLAINRSNALSINNVISGAGGFSTIGAGNTTLGGLNGYTGPTLVSQGTLTLTADQNVSSSAMTVGTAAVAGATSTAATAPANLNFAAASGTYASMAFVANSATANTLVIGAGKTVNIAGALTLGKDLGASINVGNTMTTVLNVTGAGSLAINNNGSTVNIGVAQSTQLTTATTNTLNLTGLTGDFSANVLTFNIGFGQSASGTVNLTNTTNTITAGTLNVGNSNGANGGNGLLSLGTGANSLLVDNLNLGFSKVTGTISFASTTGSVTIANRLGSGGANLIIGSVNGTGTAGGGTGVLNLLDHSATVNAAAVSVGIANSASSVSTGTGTISFNNGTFTASSLNMAAKSGTGTTSTSTGNATGTLNISGGSFTVNGAATLSSNASVVTTAAAGGVGVGNVNVSAGSLSITGTTTFSNNTASLINGTASGSTGTLTISGTGSVTLGNVTGAVKNGTATGTASATTASSIAAINISGGTLNVTGTSFVLASQASAGNATGTLSITGGTVTTAADITDGGGTATTTVTLNGGTLNMASHNIGSAATNVDVMNFQAGTLSNLGLINGSPVTPTAANGLNKTSDGSGSGGTLTITGTNGWTGPTTVTAGTLVVNGTLSATSSVTVAAGTTLKGNANITSATASVTVNGTLAPGNSAGSASIAGPLTLSNTSTYSVELGGATAGTQYDQTSANATGAASGVNVTNSTLKVTTLNGYTFFDPNGLNGDPLNANATKAAYILVQGGTFANNPVIGNFIDGNNGNSPLPEGAVVTFSDGSQANITYRANWGTSEADSSLTGGNDVALYNIQVPEPASVGLLGLGAIGLLTRRRRRR